MSPWWERNPRYLEEEYDALRVAGIEFQEDEDAKKHGVLALHLAYPCDGRILDLEVIYPDEYPFFHPDVYGPDLDLNRHFDPIGKRLCLIGDRTEEWDPETTVASYLAKRLPEVFADQASEPAPSPTEQAAPASGFFEYAPASHVLVDGAMTVPARPGYLSVSAHLCTINRTFVLRGIVAGIRNGNFLSHRWLGNISDRFNTRMKVPFTHVGRLEFINDPTEHLKALSLLNTVLLERKWTADTPAGKFALVAITFSEEVAAGQEGPGWMFFLIRQSQDGKSETVERIQAYRAGPQDFGARVPAVEILRGKRVLLVGCGAIGGPIAMDLARCQANLRLLDFDGIEPGPTIRWPLGLHYYGFAKADQLAAFLRENHPHAKVSAFHVRIGDCARRGDYKESKKRREELAKALTDLDLIVDASAEVGVQQYLSATAAQMRIPYIFASATPGAVGGMVGRFIPGDSQGCWFCLQGAIHDEDKQDIPQPAKDNEGHILPPGCTHPTFTGAAFNLAEVSQQCMRMIVQTLDGSAGSIFVSLAFEGPEQFPVWRRFPIPRYSDCPQCLT